MKNIIIIIINLTHLIKFIKSTNNINLIRGFLEFWG